MIKDYIITDRYSDSGIMRDNFQMPEYISKRDYKFLSRYSPYRRIIGKYDKAIYTETFNQKLIDESDQDTYFTVEIKTENRLDIIANRYYGYSTYWWILAIANKIIDPFDIPIGTVIRIPPLNSIYSSEGIA